MLSQALPAAQRAGVPVLLDPKVHHADYYHPITLITPNHREAELLTGMSIENESDLEAAGRKLLQKFECPYALITRGEEGMSLFSQVRFAPPADVCARGFRCNGRRGHGHRDAGAGSCGRCRQWKSPLFWPIVAAGLVVGKVGTATVSRAELLADFDSRNAHSSS